MDYQINNIYCVDSYKAIKEIPDKSIDLIYTDIPYLFGTGGHSNTEISKRINILCNKDLNNIRTGIDYAILDDFVRVLKNIYIFIWCSKEQIHDLMKYFIDKHKCSFNLLVWCKTNPIPSCNNNWLPDLEYCLVFKGKNAPRYNDGYELKSKWYASSTNMEDKKLYDHPTIKPLELVKRHLLHSTKEGDTVADFFSGSGTTCLAAKQLGRNYLGFEIDEHYYKLSIDRLNGINKNGQTDLFDTDFEQLTLLDGDKNE